MDLLWMILPVLVVCAEAENLTELKVELGQNVSLNCSLNSNIYWYIEIHRKLRGVIARTFSRDSSSNRYYVSSSITKYKAVENRLVISNITAEDCRLYFCARKKNCSFIFEDAFRLVSDVPISPSNYDSEANPQQQPHIWRIWKSEPVIYGSFALNVLLLLVLTGLVFTFLCLKRKNHNSQVTDPSPETCESLETLEMPQYEEIQLPTYRAPLSAGPPPECIYSKAQLPRATLPRH